MVNASSSGNRNACAIGYQTCQECGKRFSGPAGKTRKRKYCSASCRGKGTMTSAEASRRRALRVNNFAGVPGPKPCEQCQKVYQPTSSRQKYCASCSSPRTARSGFQRAAATETVEVTCRGCGEQFVYEYKGGRRRYYCTPECRLIALTPKGPSQRPCDTCGEGYTPLSDTDQYCRACRPKGKVTRTCAYCNTTFQTWRSQPRRFCSMACRSKLQTFSQERLCEKCGTAFTATHPRAKFCTVCVREKRDRARLRRYNLSREELERLQTRHDGKCWICLTNQGVCVDHDHSTGLVRGWLCRPCNSALHFVERPGWWERATSYLEGGGVSG